jgi:hypothetical protein
VSSLVTGSFGQNREFPLRLICGLAHCCRGTEREREREKKNWRDNKRLLFCKKLCSRAVLALSDYVYNP